MFVDKANNNTRTNRNVEYTPADKWHEDEKREYPQTSSHYGRIEECQLRSEKCNAGTGRCRLKSVSAKRRPNGAGDMLLQPTTSHERHPSYVAQEDAA